MIIRAYHEAQRQPAQEGAHPRHRARHQPRVVGAERLRGRPARVAGRTAGSTRRRCAAAMDEDVAAIMITNPNTLGIFESHIAEIAEIVHAKGGLVYGDGANMNALLGVARPGRHGRSTSCSTTCTRPSRRRTAAAAPAPGRSAVKAKLEPFLPLPVVVKEGERYRLVTDPAERPQTIGKLREFWGNFGMFVRAWALIRECGPEGARADRRARGAERQLPPRAPRGHLPPALRDRLAPRGGASTTSCRRRTASRRWTSPSGSSTTASTRRPSTSRSWSTGALMIEPTETESKETLDAFVAAMSAIAEEAQDRPGGGQGRARRGRSAPASTRRAPRASRSCAGGPG